MHIVYVLTSLGIGGAERQTLLMAARMAGRGHRVHVLVLRTVSEEWPTVLPVAAVDPVRLDMVHLDFIRLDLRKSMWSVALSLLRVRRLLRDLEPDLVHSHGFHANIFARMLRVMGSRHALISTVHNVQENGWVRPALYRLTDRLSARTTAVSEAVARRRIAQKVVSAARCVVVPNAIEIADFVPNPARRMAAREALKAGEDFMWLAAGRITPEKDYPNLLRAFARVRLGASQCGAASQARLYIAGESQAPAQEPLQQLATELGICDCVVWLGLRHDIPALLDAADAFVSSSEWEGMPLAVAEAMAMEKPVVATDAGGVRELVGDTGCVVATRAPAALAQAMLALMREPIEIRCARGRRARSRIAAQFSMDTRATDWENLYRTVVAQRG